MIFRPGTQISQSGDAVSCISSRDCYIGSLNRECAALLLFQFLLLPCNIDIYPLTLSILSKHPLATISDIVTPAMKYMRHSFWWDLVIGSWIDTVMSHSNATVTLTGYNILVFRIVSCYICTACLV